MPQYGDFQYGDEQYQAGPFPEPPSAVLDMRDAWIVEVDDVATAVLSWSASHALNQKGQCTLVLALPLPAQVVEAATVLIQARADADSAYHTRFLGFIQAGDTVYDESGGTATLTAYGPLHLLDFRSIRDMAYAGGAGTTPALLVGLQGPVHLGNDTILNYAEQAPRGTKFDASWTPAVSSSFVRLTGKYHGANNDLSQLTNPRITHYDRIEIRQGGRALGYGIFEPHDDDLGASYDTEEEFGDVGVWEDFDLTIAARLTTGAGSATARFISGYPPGGGRGDHEFQQVRRSTAAQMTARSVIRGLIKHRGFGGVSGLNYVVDEIVSYSGVVIKLGGNGFVDNGQVRVPAGESYFNFIRRVANLFEYAVYDSPDGIVRVRAVRGKPPYAAPVSASFTEGVDVLRAKVASTIENVVNYWRVLGASGTDGEGASFQYSSEPDPDSVPDSPYLPDNPGWNEDEVSDDLLISDTLCLYVRHLKEANTNVPSRVYEWESTPRTTLQPGRVIDLHAPSLEHAGRLWLIGIRDTGSEAGYWQSYTAWTGGGTPLPEAPEDPDPDEDDIEPTPDTATLKWRPYGPRSGA